MFKTQETTGSLIPFCLRQTQLPLARNRNGSTSFKHVECDSTFTERTITLHEVEDGKNTGEYTIAIPMLGDSIHTLVLKYHGDEDCAHGSYELVGMTKFPMEAPKPTYTEGMTFETNRTLALASGWPISKGVIPLMLGLTIRPLKYHLPLLTVHGNVEDHVFHTYHLVIRGFFPTKKFSLDVDYVYFDKPTRIQLAQKPNVHDDLVASNFVSVDRSNTVLPISCGSMAKIDFRNIARENPWFSLDTVTGIIVKPEVAGTIEQIAMFINGHEYIACFKEDIPLYWKKVTLKDPEDGSILLPFSRNMWIDPENAAFVDFSRVDTIQFRIKCVPVVQEMRATFTALGHKSRVLNTQSRIFYTL